MTFHLNRVKTNAAGFDSAGKHWPGEGVNLYHAWCPAGQDTEFTEHFTRAETRDAAKAIISARFPGCSFHR